MRSILDPRFCSAALVASVVVPCLLATPRTASAQRFDRSRLQALADSLRSDMRAPGAVLGLRARDGRQGVAASGLADVETGRPLRSVDPYYLGSITKTYTAALVLRLVEAGELSLDDPLSRFFPSVPLADETTLRDLLQHTSGLKDVYAYFYFRPDRDEMIEMVTRRWTEEEILELVGRLGHWFDPGAEWSYSSTNYYLLGQVVERVTGLRLEDAYRTRLYRPLGLERTWLARHDEPMAPLPTGYMGPVEGWEHSEMFGELGPTTALDQSSIERAAGGLVAPAAEAMLFLSSLFDGGLLAPASVAVMTDVRPTPPLGVAVGSEGSDQGSDGYGLGLVRMEAGGLTALGHGGLYNGHTAGLWHVPECGVTVALYFNRGFVGQRDALGRVLAALADGRFGVGPCGSGAN